MVDARFAGFPEAFQLLPLLQKSASGGVLERWLSGLKQKFAKFSGYRRWFFRMRGGGRGVRKRAFTLVKLIHSCSTDLMSSQVQILFFPGKSGPGRPQWGGPPGGGARKRARTWGARAPSSGPFGPALAPTGPRGPLRVP